MTAETTSVRKATLIGLCAILFWGALVGLIRVVAENFGATLGAALLYTGAAAVLWVIRRPRGVRDFPRRYLLICGALFVFYELCLGLSVGFAADARQAIEVSVVNYLWPTFTVLLAVALPPWRRVGWTFVPGVLLALFGVVSVVGGKLGIDAGQLIANLASNPLPYGLAFAGALTWAFYSVLTPRLSRGSDGITLFFTGTAVALWTVHLVAGVPSPPMGAGVPGVVALLVGSVVIALGYACWNIGVLHGNLTVLASASYATPVLSAAIASLLLGTRLSWPFWQAVGFVAIGSLLGWWATRDRPPRKSSPAGTS